MSSRSARDDHQSHPPTPTVPKLSHIVCLRPGQRNINSEGETELTIKCTDGRFEDHVFKHGVRVASKPCASEQLFKTLLHGLATVAHNGGFWIPECCGEPQRIRIIDYLDRKLVVAHLCGDRRVIVVGAMRSDFTDTAGQPVQLWRPVMNDLPQDIFLVTSDLALLVACQNLIEKGFWP